MPAVNIKDYIDLPRPDTVWIWRGIIPTSGSVLIFGDVKVGKSKLILSLAEAISDPNISNYLGLDIQQHGRILYVQLDTPRNLWVNGYLSFIKSERARENIFILDREMPDIPRPFDMRLPSCHDWLRREVDTVEPVMVIVDTIRRMHKGDENDSTVMSSLHDSFQSATSPAALGYITHKRKMQHGELGDGVVRGSSALMGAVDGLINMTKSKLKIEARSDVDEEINIYQRDDGTFALNGQTDEIQHFLANLDSSVGQSDKDKMIAEHFAVSVRTARRWRKDLVVVKG